MGEELRKTLRGTYLALLLEVAGLYEEHGDFRSALEALRQAVPSEPTHESVHTQLMRMYAVWVSERSPSAIRAAPRDSLARVPYARFKRIDGRRFDAGSPPTACSCLADVASRDILGGVQALTVVATKLTRRVVTETVQEAPKFRDAL